MKPGDLILRNQKPASVRHVVGSFFSALTLHGLMLSFLALLLVSTVFAAADICRAATGNYRLFDLMNFFGQANLAYQLDPVAEKERSRLERSDLDAYRNERWRWQQLRDEVKDRSFLRKSKKSAKLHARL
jgi:hypothetical protein